MMAGEQLGGAFRSCQAHSDDLKRCVVDFLGDRSMEIGDAEVWLQDLAGEPEAGPRRRQGARERPRKVSSIGALSRSTIFIMRTIASTTTLRTIPVFAAPRLEEK